MTEGTHQPLTIAEVREQLAFFEEKCDPMVRDWMEYRALRMLEAAWEATEPFIEPANDYMRGMLDADAMTRRAIFGRTEEEQG